MRELLRRTDVINALQEYRNELLAAQSKAPKDLAWDHKLHALYEIDLRIRMLFAGGLKVINGGLNRKETEL